MASAAHRPTTGLESCCAHIDGRVAACWRSLEAAVGCLQSSERLAALPELPDGGQPSKRKLLLAQARATQHLDQLGTLAIAHLSSQSRSVLSCCVLRRRAAGLDRCAGAACSC